MKATPPVLQPLVKVISVCVSPHLLVLAVMPGHCAVGSLCLDGLPVGAHQHGGHQAQGAEACRDRPWTSEDHTRLTTGGLPCSLGHITQLGWHLGADPMLTGFSVAQVNDFKGPKKHTYFGHYPDWFFSP